LAKCFQTNNGHYPRILTLNANLTPTVLKPVHKQDDKNNTTPLT